MGQNTASITYDHAEKEALIVFDHARSDYKAMLTLRREDIGPDSGVLIEDLTPAGKACIPAELLVEAIYVLYGTEMSDYEFRDTADYERDD